MQLTTVYQSDTCPVWRLFTSTALGSSVVAGFSVGAVLFAARLVPGLSLPPHFAAFHGYVQVHAFAVLMTLGVLYWFLPRLWGTVPAPTRRVSAAFALLFGGLWAVLAGSLLAAESLVVAGSVVQVAGACLVVADFFCFYRGRQHRTKGHDPALLAALVVASLSLPLAYVFRAWAVRDTVRAFVDLSYLLAFYGVLVPIALTMSGRLFPLYFRTRLPSRGWLAFWLGIGSVGLVFRMLGLVSGMANGVRIGSGLQGSAILGAIVALRLVEPRVPRPGAARVLWRDPTAWIVHGAYLCLGVVAFLHLHGLVTGESIPLSLEWHLVGVGYATCLIVGVGMHLLPGFARQRMRSQRVAWVLLLSSFGMVLLRLVPFVGEGVYAALSGTVAGVLGVATVTLFAWNVGLLAPLRRTTSDTDEFEYTRVAK